MVKREIAFDNWPKPRGKGNCPPESKLAEWIRDGDSAEAQAHSAECETCSAVIRDVQSASRSNGNLNSFMADVRKQAQQDAEQYSSKWKMFQNYVFASRMQTAGAFAAAGAVVLILAAGLWRQFGIQRSEAPAQAIVIHQDINGDAYRQAVAALRDSYLSGINGGLSKRTAAAQIGRLNQRLGKVDKAQLQPEQKHELEILQAKYQALVFDRLHPVTITASADPSAGDIPDDFYSKYAGYLARAGDPLTLLPGVNLKSSRAKVYVITGADLSESRKTAASLAVRDLQNQAHGISVEYKPINDGGAPSPN
jgi:hypothetical protein